MRKRKSRKIKKGGQSTINLLNPRGIVTDLNGNLLIADSGNHRILRMNMVTGTLTTIASPVIRLL